ncbi:hypothetical protein [Kitasatospora sp. NPDC056531]|uniref:hypothetical protein n=1 Tax=Kitasatospora sp. NPDC056531 TaxID=3345856 RepID=UPI0036BC28A9
MARCEVETGGPGQQLRDTVISGGARPKDGLLRPVAVSSKAVRQALGDLALHGLVASDGNTRDRHKTWRLEGAAGLDAAAAVLGMVRSEMGGTARGAWRSGAQHAMAVNETVLAFVLGGSAPGAAGGVGTVRSWSTETEFLLPGGKRKVRPDGVWQAPEIGVPVLMGSSTGRSL